VDAVAVAVNPALVTEAEADVLVEAAEEAAPARTMVTYPLAEAAPLEAAWAVTNLALTKSPVHPNLAADKPAAPSSL
jgi:hypothetical protein